MPYDLKNMGLSQRKIKASAMLTTLSNIGLGLLFSSDCLVCQKPLEWSTKDLVCVICRMKVRPIQEPFCYKCGLPMSTETGCLPMEEIRCESCRKNPPLFARARSIFYYENSIRELIHKFKYERKVRVGKWLAGMLLNYWQKEPFFLTAQCVVPVPIDIKRLRHREFNQSAILAKKVAGHLNIPVYPLALRKIKGVSPQVKLSGQERIHNVAGAFDVRQKQNVYQKEVLLVDDVFTTGSTISECSRILLKHGAKKVYVLTLARSIGFG